MKLCVSSFTWVEHIHLKDTSNESMTVISRADFNKETKQGRRKGEEPGPRMEGEEGSG